MAKEQGDKELKRLMDGMTQFKSNPPPIILVTEIIHPADPRGRSGIFDEVKNC